MTARTQPAEVVEVRDVSRDVRELVLRPTEHEIAFKAGQWVSVHLPLGGDKPVVRAYTLAEPPCEKNRLVLCFDRVKGGAASTFLFEARPGDRLTVSDALGTFVMPESERRGVAFVTWLTGVVPMRCMLLEMTRCWNGPPPRTLLVYGAPTADRLVYDDQLRDLAAAHPWFTYEPVVPTDGDDLAHGVEEILRRLPGAVARAFPEGAGPHSVHPMIAGLKALVLPTRDWFMQHLGYALSQVQKETYD